MSLAPASVAPGITAAPTAAWLPTSSASSAEATPLATPALVTGVTFPPAAWGNPWKVLGGERDPNNVYKTIEGIRPPDGVYVLDWAITGMPCEVLLTKGLDIWSFASTRSPGQNGLALADLVDAAEDPYEMFSSGCDAWGVAIRPLKTYFGPNSVQVARLLIRADELGSDWELVASEEVSPEALAIEALVLDAGKRDPNLGAALYRARAASWEYGNKYLADNPAAATLRRLAITAEVAQALLPAHEFDVLYGPMANYIDPLELGMPTHS